MGIAIGQAVRKTAGTKGISIGRAKVDLVEACGRGLIRAWWPHYPHYLSRPQQVPRHEFSGADIDVEKDVLILTNGERKGDVYLDETDFESWLCDQAAPLANHAADEGQAARQRTKPMRERAEKAITELYPNGVPDQITLTNDALYRAVCGHLNLKSKEQPSFDTVLRAAERRKDQ